MRIAAISDTHGLNFKRPQADVFIHAGDMTAWGKYREAANLGKALENGEDFSLAGTALPGSKTSYGGAPGYEAVILVPGNHDINFELYPKTEMYPFSPRIHLLVDEAWEHDGLVFYGTPWVPPISGVISPQWSAFMRSEDELHRRFENMPESMDVLITHGPPQGILDAGKGSMALREAIEKRKIRKHLFGHIHECSGMTVTEFREEGNRESHNLAALDGHIPSYTKPPLVFDLEARA